MEPTTYTILVINPGSTSTKVALYENESEKFRKSLEHSNEDLKQFENIIDQHELREQAILTFLDEIGVAPDSLSAIMSRGGLLPPVKSGAYQINEQMVDRLTHRPIAEHASNLGAVIAYSLATSAGIPAYIYDPVSVDELEDVARISGMPVIERQSLIHALNMRAAAIKVAQQLGTPYQELNLIVAHLGGGITISLHKHGKMADIVSDDEGPFSPERAGRVPCRQLIELCYSGKYEYKEMRKMLRGKGGLIAYLGTNEVTEVQKRMKEGDERAALIYQAMLLQIAKGIGELAVVVKGQVDRIVITGGIAHSNMTIDWIREHVQFIAPVEVVAGENELQALALGALRVLRGEETAYTYDLG